MSLTEYMRGVLENLIDQAINMTPIFVNMTRNNNPPEFGITTLDYYVLGIVQGSIMGTFVSFYRSSLAQDLPPNLQIEVGQIIFRNRLVLPYGIVFCSILISGKLSYSILSLGLKKIRYKSDNSYSCSNCTCYYPYPNF